MQAICQRDAEPVETVWRTNGAEEGSSGASAHRASSEIALPFCGDEYPPLKGSPGAVICTKACHPETQMHMNEESGWVWWDQ